MLYSCLFVLYVCSDLFCDIANHVLRLFWMAVDSLVLNLCDIKILKKFCSPITLLAWPNLTM